jgi:predicted Zn-dependent protease
LNRAVQADPLQLNNRLWRGIASWLSGDLTSASQDFRTVLDKRPLYGPARMFLGETMREGGDVPGAIREIEKVLEQAPNNISAISGLTLAYLDNKEVDKARTLLNGVEKLYAGNYVWRQAVALLLAVDGERERALAAMDDDTLKHAAAAFTATLTVAEFYATLGDTTKAIEWLERSIRNGDERTAWFRKSPRLASIHQDPRFSRIIDTVERRKRDAAR